MLEELKEKQTCLLRHCEETKSPAWFSYSSLFSFNIIYVQKWHTYLCKGHSFISFSLLRLGWQEPEPSHVTGMALAHCILGKFLWVVCHCFSPPLDVPTFAAMYLYIRNDARDPSSERWKCGREICPVILPKFQLPRKFRDLLLPS